MTTSLICPHCGNTMNRIAGGPEGTIRFFCLCCPTGAQSKTLHLATIVNTGTRGFGFVKPDLQPNAPGLVYYENAVSGRVSRVGERVAVLLEGTGASRKIRAVYPGSWPARTALPRPPRAASPKAPAKPVSMGRVAELRAIDWGFIEDGAGRRFFFHKKECGGHVPRVGQRVSFVVKTTAKGIAACEVRPS